MPSLLANGETLHYLDEGAGPAVLFVHSMGANGAMWRPVIAALRDRYRCLAVDCRGHGKTSYRDMFTVPEVAADLNAMLDQLDIGRVHLVGASMGGPILLEMYATRPGRIASLAVAGSFYDMRAHAAQRLAQTEAQLSGVTMLEFGRAYARSRLMPATAPEAFDALADAVSMLSPAAYMETSRAISTVGFQGLLAAVSVPMLILYGDCEMPEIRQQCREMAEAVPGARIEVIADAGHLAAIDQPTTFAKLLGDFLDATAAR